MSSPQNAPLPAGGGMCRTEDMDAGEMATVIDTALAQAGLGIRVARIEHDVVTARALHNALIALPPRAVDSESGEVVEEEADDAYAEIAAATEKGQLLPLTAE